MRILTVEKEPFSDALSTRYSFTSAPLQHGFSHATYATLVERLLTARSVGASGGPAAVLTWRGSEKGPP